MKAWILVFAFLILISLSSSNAYAENWTTKLWFITNNETGCTIWNELALNFYQSVAVQYIPMYDLHGTMIDGICLRMIDVVNNYDEFIKARQSVDLPIIVLDRVIGTSQLKIMQNEYGHMRFADDERFGIVFGSFASFTVEDKKSAWTLSHEISHYALFHKGTPWSVYVDDVHKIQTEYDSCKDKKQCTELWTTVTSPAGQSVHVMKPITEIKNYEPTNVPTIPTPSFSSDDVNFLLSSVKLVVKENDPVSISGFADASYDEGDFLSYAKLSLKKYPEGTTIQTTTSDTIGRFTFNLTGVKNIETYDRDSGISTWDMYVEFAGDSKNKSAKSQTIRLTVVGLAESSIFEKYFPKDDVSTPEPSTPEPSTPTPQTGWQTEPKPTTVVTKTEVYSDKEYYIVNDVITIKGQTPSKVASVKVRIDDPNGNLVKLIQIPDNGLNDFSTSIKIEKFWFTTSGEYTINAWTSRAEPDKDAITVIIAIPGSEPVKKKVVPTWVKNNAELWAGGQIDDEAFVQGLQFLIKEKIINVESAPVTSNDSKGMPTWIKSNAEWWTQGLISEDEFLKGIEYLVEKRIINLD